MIYGYVLSCLAESCQDRRQADLLVEDAKRVLRVRVRAAERHFERSDGKVNLLLFCGLMNSP